MKKMMIKGTLLGGHKDHAVEVPFDPASFWNTAAKPLWRGRRGHQVLVTIDKLNFESAIVPRQKKFYLLIPDETAKQANIQLGEVIKATVAALSK